MRYITIALAKGRLAKKAMEIFEQIGIPCEEMKDEKTRKLIDRKSTRLNSSHITRSRMPSSA